MTALTDTRAALENAEDRATQFAEEFSLAKAQIEEKEAEERLAKDRENKLRDQVAALVAQQLQANALRSSRASSTVVSSPPRPDSRTSILYPSRSATPTASVDLRTNPSVWDSMHAPAPSVSGKKQGPLTRGRFVKQDWRAASPTLSVVSVAPTLGDDGWYE